MIGGLYTPYTSIRQNQSPHVDAKTQQIFKMASVSRMRDAHHRKSPSHVQQRVRELHMEMDDLVIIEFKRGQYLDFCLGQTSSLGSNEVSI